MPRKRSTADATVEQPLVDWTAGVHVRNTAIWCDAPRAHGLCFLSHAGAVTVALRSPLKILATDATVALLTALKRAPAGEVLRSPFGRPFALGRARLELLPSGRTPGGAQLVVEVGGRRVLYAGALRTAPGPGAAAPQARACDVMIAEPPAPAMPPRQAGLALLDGAVSSARAVGALPIVVAPPLGLAEELAVALGARGTGVHMPARWLPLARALGGDGPVPRKLQRNALAPGDVVVWPVATARDAGELERWARAAGGPVHRLVAPLPSPLMRLVAAEVVLPLGDLATPRELVDHALTCGARTLYLVEPSAEALTAVTAVAAQARRQRAARALEVVALAPPQQIALALGPS